MSGFEAAVIGVGNEFRRDDGVGPAVVALLDSCRLPGVRVVATDGEPTALLEAWSGVDLAVVVDAVRCDPSLPGRLHRTDLRSPPTAPAGRASSHGLGLHEALRLARALDRTPPRIVAYLVEVDDVGFGRQLSPAVSAAVPRVAAAVLTELGGVPVGA
ncbi:MAG: hydrogenase maturation protease [Blastococcus sp.]